MKQHPNKLKRRDFIKYSGGSSALLFSGLLWPTNMFAAFPDMDFLGRRVRKPIHTKVNIKPLCAARIHKSAYEGPCRSGTLNKLSSEAEKIRSIESCNEFIVTLKNNACDDALIMEPEKIEYAEGDIIDDKTWKIIDEQIDNIDIFLIEDRVPGLEKYNKPVVMVGKGVTNVDIAAYYKMLGIPAFASYDWDEFNKAVKALKVKKAMAATKPFVLTNRLDKLPYSVYSNITDLEYLKKSFGINTEAVSFDDFFGKMDQIAEEKTITSRLSEKAIEIIEDAETVNMNEKTLIYDLQFYYTIMEYMKEKGYNAFSVRCFELCASKIPWEKGFVPCAGISMLKDLGIAASCEGDMNALLALMVLMYLSNKAAFMGNPEIDTEQNLIKIHHDVPGLKMKGLSEPGLPYSIVSFTNTGFGGTIRYDFSLDIGQPVTMCRFDPTAKKLLLKKGTIAGCFNKDKIGCSLGVSIKIDNALDFFHKSSEFGHHLAMVYGDYADEVLMLEQVMDIEVVT